MTSSSTSAAPVPAQDSAANISMSDAIGNKADTHYGTSVLGKLDAITDHIHSRQMIYPTAADPIVLTAGGLGGGWTDGAWVEIVPVSTIAVDFDIHAIYVSSPSANADFEIDLDNGTSVIGTSVFTRTGVFTGSLELEMQTDIQPANTQIRARLRSGDDAGQTCGIKLKYHTY